MYTSITLELDTADYDFDTESDLIEQVLLEVGEFAAEVDADVDVEVTTIDRRLGTIVVAVAGSYIEVGLFNRRWFTRNGE
jgi:hypothetical protein